MKFEAPAKINLTWDVTGLRHDGYHLVRMVMQSVTLKDIITIEKDNGIEPGRDSGKSGIVLTCNDSNLETDESNLICKAALRMKERFSITDGVRIHLEKNIPLAAGLAGGSSDAAATLRGMSELFDLKVSQKELMDIGVTIGADVPYCVMGKTALAEGIGEILTVLPEMPDCGILLAKPKESVSTGGVYKALDALNGYEHPDTEGMIRSLEEKDIEKTGRLLCNVLENVTAVRNPSIGMLKNQMLQTGAFGALMSGSGPTVFGIYESCQKAKNAGDMIKDLGFDGDVFAVSPMQPQ